jgi:UDPglucose 6-dehydrogenase
MFVRRVAVVGAGYVGLTTATCLAALGHRVVCADIDAGKVERLRGGEVDIYEPGLQELVVQNMAAGRLSFVVGPRAAVLEAVPEVVFLCVPTPMGQGGAADLAAVEAVIEEVRDLLPADCVVVNKSTVPVGTAARVAGLLGRDDVAVASNPEFLREGSAVADFMQPDRIVVGADAQYAAERVAALYARLGVPALLTDAASAEMIKYSANCFIAMKLSYVNAISELCEKLGADVVDVTDAMGYDRRIAQACLAPGPGWGGSCLPKDTAAMLTMSEAVGFDFLLLRATMDTNARQCSRVVAKVTDAVGGTRDGTLAGARICLLGLTFKAGTDDLRGSPALAVAAALRDAGAELTGYDPQVPVAVCGVTDAVTVLDDPYLAAKGAEVIVVLTEWPEFRGLDWARLAAVVDRPVVVDARNLLDSAMLRRAGFEVRGLGRRDAKAAAGQGPVAS